jgi:hypothetical protein
VFAATRAASFVSNTLGIFLVLSLVACLPTVPGRYLYLQGLGGAELAILVHGVARVPQANSRQAESSGTGASSTAGGSAAGGHFCVWLVLETAALQGISHRGATASHTEDVLPKAVSESLHGNAQLQLVHTP